ncbi:MAG: hypothetical protein AAGC65_06960 [Mucilaginibacter sp.]|uniref:hypothetical protein n=1 Tax=Mucilaginibacter sp. TaxID=1882438 RepID=UPI0031A9E4C3
MEYRGTFEVENFKDFGIVYLKGILNTYAALNTPDSTLAYDYNIVKVKKENQDLVKAIKDSFDVFVDQSFKLDLITNEYFKNALKNWLFEKKIVSDYRIKRQTDFIYDLIKEVSNFQTIYAINELDLTTFSYDFGVGYEYFLLDSVVDSYIIYFNYSD